MLLELPTKPQQIQPRQPMAKMPLGVAYLLRKYNPREWGGTETAVKLLLDGVKAREVTPTIFAPRTEDFPRSDPFTDSGYRVRQFGAFVPVAGISPQQRRQLVSIGGNLLSFSLPWMLWRAPGLSLIHTQTLGRLAGSALRVAAVRRIPFVVTIHGGVLDLSEQVREKLLEPLRGGTEWGKLFGFLVKSRRVLEDADAVVTCNETEAALLREKYPAQRIIVQPHGVSLRAFQEDRVAAAEEAYPRIRGKRLLLCLGRIDPVKNQRWLVAESAAIFRRHPDAFLVFAGSVTDEPYGEALRRDIERAGVEDRVLLTGGLPPGDPRLIGLLQKADALLSPSLSETFGLVFLEAWAANTTVIASRTSGACALIEEGRNGRLFDLSQPAGLHAAVDEALREDGARVSFANAGRGLVEAKYDLHVLAGRMRDLYDELIERKRR